MRNVIALGAGSLTMPFAGWMSTSAMPDLDHYLRREQRRERLIAAALKLWAASGYDAVTVDQIAAYADIAPDHFEDYFESKDAVVMAVLDDILRAIVEGRQVTTADRLAAELAAAFYQVTGEVSGF